MESLEQAGFRATFDNLGAETFERLRPYDQAVLVVVVEATAIGCSGRRKRELKRPVSTTLPVVGSPYAG